MSACRKRRAINSAMLSSWSLSCRMNSTSASSARSPDTSSVNFKDRHKDVYYIAYSANRKETLGNGPKGVLNTHAHALHFAWLMKEASELRGSPQDARKWQAIVEFYHPGSKMLYQLLYPGAKDCHTVTELSGSQASHCNLLSGHLAYSIDNPCVYPGCDEPGAHPSYSYISHEGIAAGYLDAGEYEPVDVAPYLACEGEAFAGFQPDPSEARALFDGHSYAAAAAAFQHVIEMIGLEEAGGSDLRFVAGEYLALSRASLASLQSHVYTQGDAGVSEPVALGQFLPSAPDPSLPQSRLAVLELIIDVRGFVETARLQGEGSQYRTGWWVSAAKAWRFQPAMKDGNPVRFLKRVVVADSKPLEPR